MTDGNRVPTGNLELLSPAGRHRGTRVPTDFRVSESHIPRKHWGSAPKMARVCPLSAELRGGGTLVWRRVCGRAMSPETVGSVSMSAVSMFSRSPQCGRACPEPPLVAGGVVPDVWGARGAALPDRPLQRQAQPAVALGARVAPSILPDVQGAAGRAVPDAAWPASEPAACRAAAGRTARAAGRRSRVGGAGALGGRDRTGALLRGRRQPGQHCRGDTRGREEARACPLEQRRGRTPGSTRRASLGALRAVPRPSTNQRPVDVGCARAPDCCRG